MAYQKTKIEQYYVRKLIKLARGQSYAVVLPIEAVRAFGWQGKQKLLVLVNTKKQKFIIKDWQKHLNI